VSLLDVNPEGLSKTVGCLETARCQHSTCEIDLADKKKIDQFWARLDAESPPDILVNNAGVYPMEGYLDVDEEFLEKVFNVNMKSAFWMCENFIRLRKERGASPSTSLPLRQFCRSKRTWCTMA